MSWKKVRKVRNIQASGSPPRSAGAVARHGAAAGKTAAVFRKYYLQFNQSIPQETATGATPRSDLPVSAEYQPGKSWHQINMMKKIRNCNSCEWCTDKNFEDQDGLCCEPHAPRNAKGKITSRTRLGALACRMYRPAAAPGRKKAAMTVNDGTKNSRSRPKER